MTRKDYKAIAAAVWGQTITAAPQTCINPDEFMRGAREQADNYLYAIADAMAADNPRFNREAFIAACREGRM